MSNFFYNINTFSLSKRTSRPLILDGAIGSYLQQKKVNTSGRLWSSIANIENPEAVFNLHKAYIDAGADILTTNTFRTNPEAVKESNEYNSSILVKTALKLAKEAVNELPVFIAGSNAPAEDCYQKERTLSKKELVYNHHKHIDLLMEAGCDFILNETQSHPDEIKIICKYCSKENIPYVISFFFKNDLKLLSDDNLFDVVKLVFDYSPNAIGFNCIIPSAFKKILPHISGEYNWGFYLNCGSGNYTDEIINCSISPKEYIKEIKTSLKMKPSFIGSCCGSSPNHIYEIKRLLDGRIKS